MLCFKGSARLAVCHGLLVLMAVTAVACSGPAQLAVPTRNPAAATQQAVPPATSPVSPPSTAQPLQASAVAASENATDNTTPAVRILQIHFRGSLEALGCCNNQLYERDEFVAIQNAGNTPQDISGWKLVNATRGYPVFTFPAHFPCIAFTPSSESKYVASVENYVASSPQSVDQVFTPSPGTQQTTTTPIDWSVCNPIDPLDETPMRPAKGQQQGTMAPCLLYPGQIVLVFTDEIHCQYGGLTFRYGLGNLWNNESPDTAVLYNSNGEEVSRRSYTLGK
ncbi:MAG: lamin tail domain-containing protein [Chloroflexi bacterium]|nr:lamin tail domain-containing protein [Chloroflexota bacterium]